MVKLVRSLEDLMKLLSGEEPESHDHDKDNICFCGTKDDAAKAALKMMEQMQDNDCILWAMQVAAAAHVIALAMSANAVNGSGLYEEIRISMTETVLSGENSTRLNTMVEKMDRLPLH